MKLIFINRYFYPDVSATSQILFDLTKELANKGLEIEIICSRLSYENKAILYPKNEVSKGIKVHRVRTTNFGRVGFIGRALDYFSFYIFSTIKLFRIVHNNDLVVAKTDPPLLSVPCALVARYKNAKLINWMQDVFPEVYVNLGYYCPKSIFMLLRALRNWSMRTASANVLLGSLMRKEFLSQGLTADSLCIIENWASESVQRPIELHECHLRKQLQLKDKFVVAYSGNLGRAHDYQTLLGAAKLLADEKEVLFLIIGGGNGYEKLKKETTDKKLNNFVFLSYQKRESLSDVLAAANIHLISLLPSLEGLIVPSKFYGILSSARPSIMIGSQEGEVSTEIRAGRLGGVVDIGDCEGLVKWIRYYKDNPSIAKFDGDRAYGKYFKSFTLDRAVSKWMNLIEKINNE